MLTQRPIMDAGPGINFFSIHKERLLFATVGPIAVPETVEGEIRKKSRSDSRFASAAPVMGKLPEKLFKVLSDDVTEELADAIQLISGTPAHERLLLSRDLGEIMVVAHAVVAAAAGHQVVILVDDGDGRKLAAIQARRFKTLQAAGQSVGSIRLISTISVLRKAAGTQHLPTRTELRRTYGRLRGLDDGLLPLEDTGLMHLPCWSAAARAE